MVAGARDLGPAFSSHTEMRSSRLTRMNQMSQSANPGWYTNPQNPDQQRWWDGQAWTEHWRQTPSADAPAATLTGPPPAPASAATQDTWWSRRSAFGKTMTVLAAGFFGLVLLGSLLPDTDEQPVSTSNLQESPSPRAKKTAPLANPTPSSTTRPRPSPSASRVENVLSPTTQPSSPSPEPAASTPSDSTADPAPATIPARLVLSDDRSAEIIANRDVEESLAQTVVDAVEDEAWWPYVGQVSVDEDLFVSDVRLRIDVLMHPDIVPTAVDMCRAVVAALPSTYKVIAVQIQPTSPFGGGQEIDGSDEPWRFNYSTLIRGGNSGSQTCEPVDPSDQRPTSSRQSSS